MTFNSKSLHKIIFFNTLCSYWLLPSTFHMRSCGKSKKPQCLDMSQPFFSTSLSFSLICGKKKNTFKVEGHIQSLQTFPNDTHCMLGMQKYVSEASVMPGMCQDFKNKLSPWPLGMSIAISVKSGWESHSFSMTQWKGGGVSGKTDPMIKPSREKISNANSLSSLKVEIIINEY